MAKKFEKELYQLSTISLFSPHCFPNRVINLLIYTNRAWKIECVQILTGHALLQESSKKIENGVCFTLWLI